MGEFYDDLFIKPDWGQLSWDYRCTDKYKHPQDLSAMFHNSGAYIIDKASQFKQSNGYLPVKDLRKLCYEFRTHFPVTGRVEGVRYVDEEIEEFILNNSRLEYWSKIARDNYMWVAAILGAIGWVIKSLLSK